MTRYELEVSGVKESPTGGWVTYQDCAREIVALKNLVNEIWAATHTARKMLQKKVPSILRATRGVKYESSIHFVAEGHREHKSGWYYSDETEAFGNVNPFGTYEEARLASEDYGKWMNRTPNRVLTPYGDAKVVGMEFLNNGPARWIVEFYGDQVFAEGKRKTFQLSELCSLRMNDDKDLPLIKVLHEQIVLEDAKVRKANGVANVDDSDEVWLRELFERSQM